MRKYKEYLKKQPMAGYWTTYDFGFLIYDIDETEEKVLIANFACGQTFGFRKNKIYYDLKGEPYFNHFGRKIYFNECLRLV